MSDATKNFSLRLSADDQARLEQVAERYALDRTGVLRLLIRRAAVALAVEGRFTTIQRGRAGHAISVRLMQERSER